MRGDSFGNKVHTSNNNRHYESCLKSTCSRSSSPVHRQLWDPKHLQEKLKDNNKKPSHNVRFHDNVSRQTHLSFEDRGESSIPSFATTSPTTQTFALRKDQDSSFFTYSITNNVKKDVEVTIQPRSPPKSSPPLSRSRSPELRRPHSIHQCKGSSENRAGNLTLQLDLEGAKAYPTANVQNKAIDSKLTQTVNSHPSSPTDVISWRCNCNSCTVCCCTSCPKEIGAANSNCNSCSFLCVSSPKEPCDKTCDSRSCPCYCSESSTAKVDKATSPIKPGSSPQEHRNKLCGNTGCQPTLDLCTISISSQNKEDRGTSPITPSSRSPSPTLRASLNHSPVRSRANSIKSHDSRVQINIDANRVRVDVKGVQTIDVGPYDTKPHAENLNTENADRNGTNDTIHNYDPQLEVFYTSSYNQSQTPSISKLRSCSPSPPVLSPRYDSQPPWNPCTRLDHTCPSEKHSCTSSPSYKSPSRSPSPQTPKSICASVKSLSRTNSSKSLEICTRESDGEIITTIDWKYPLEEKFPVHNNDNGAPSRDYKDCQNVVETPRFYSSHQSSLGPVVTQISHKIGDGRVQITCSTDGSSEQGTCITEHEEHRPFDSYSNNADYHPTYSDNCDGLDYAQECCGLQRCCMDGYHQGHIDIDIEHDSHNETAYSSTEDYPHTVVQVRSHSSLSALKPKPAHERICMESKLSQKCSTSSAASACVLTCCTRSCGSTAIIGAKNDEVCSDCCPWDTNCMRFSREGLNMCPSLPPHLQSDWSANLRCSSNNPKTKPVIYKDSKGKEHVMFADGSIEHLNADWQPPSSPTPLSCVCETPQTSSSCQIEHNIHHDHRSKEPYQHSMKFSPRSGDIIIRAFQRLPCMYPGKDNGQVSFFTSDYLDLHEGDSIVRLGKFDESGKWSASKAVEMYMRGSHGQWTFLGVHDGLEHLHPLDADRHQTVKTPNKELKPKLGDLIISPVPSPNSFYFWNPKASLECNHSKLLLRAYIGKPQITDDNHNLMCCVEGHLPVGYAELYVKVNKVWLFLGRDDHMFSEHELLHFS